MLRTNGVFSVSLSILNYLVGNGGKSCKYDYMPKALDKLLKNNLIGFEL